MSVSTSKDELEIGDCWDLACSLGRKGCSLDIKKYQSLINSAVQVVYSDKC